MGAGQVTIAANAEGVLGYGLLTVAVPGMEPVNLWSVMSSPDSSSLSAVWGTKWTDMYCVGDRGYSGTILHYDGGAWSMMSSPTGNPLMDVWGTASNDVHAVVWDGAVGLWVPV